MALVVDLVVGIGVGSLRYVHEVVLLGASKCCRRNVIGQCKLREK
jgi:hypothetical protein